jgi:hypothetical protein
MNTFAQSVEGWHDFYHVIGDAGAALIGLLFVSLSLNVSVITHKTNTDLRKLATRTFTNFICLIMFALLFLIPNQGPLGLGVPMLGIDAIVLYVTVRRFIEMRHNSNRAWGRGGLTLRFVTPTICFVTVLIIGVTVLMGKTGGLYWFVPVVIL